MQAPAGSRRFSRILGWLFADGVDFGAGTFISRFGCGLMGLMMAAVVAMAAAPELTRFLPVVIAGGFLLCIDVLWTSAEGWLAIGDLLDRAHHARQSRGANHRPGRVEPGRTRQSPARRGLPARDWLSRLIRALVPLAVLSGGLGMTLGLGVLWRELSCGVAAVLPLLVGLLLYVVLVALVVWLSLRDEGLDADHAQTDFTRLRNRNGVSRTPGRCHSACSPR